MKGIKYKLMVYDNMLDKIHNFGTEITEVFVPKDNLLKKDFVFNQDGYFFFTEDGNVDRMSEASAFEDVEVDPEITLQMHQYLEIDTSKLREYAENFFK